MATDPQSRRVNEAQAAQYLGVSDKTLRRWRWAGRGPGYIKLGSAVRYDTADLDAFLDAGRRHSTAEAAAWTPPRTTRTCPRRIAPEENESTQRIPDIRVAPAR